MAYDPNIVRLLQRYAPQAADDPDSQAAFVASAIIESGLNPRAVGDGGRSIGLFQEHEKGRGFGLSAAQRMDPESNIKRAASEFRRFYGQGARGADLAYRAQRPADQQGYVSKLQQRLAEARGLLGGAPGQTPAPVSGVQPQQASGFDDMLGNIGTALATRNDTGEKRESFTSAVRRGLLSQAISSAGSGAPGGMAAVTAAQGLGTLADPSKKQVVNAALQQQGTPYSWGGGSPSGPTRGIQQGANTVGFDCSALVQMAWAKAGVNLPRTTYDQIKVGTAIPSLAQAQPGDLLFPNTGHVQMYLGNGQVVEAPRTGGVVQVVPVRNKYIAIRRPA